MSKSYRHESSIDNNKQRKKAGHRSSTKERGEQITKKYMRGNLAKLLT